MKMRGRSPYNRPSIRRTELYKLLLDLGGEARWKELEANLKKLGWGPTTLKRTLDEMIEEGSIIKEARLGSKGPEAWYKVQIKDGDIWPPFKEALDKGNRASLQLVAQSIKEKAETLEGKERKAFLKVQMRKIVKMSSDVIPAFLYMMAKGALQKTRKRKLFAIFDYIFDAVLKNHLKEYAEVLMDYPEESLIAISELLIANKDKLEELRTDGLRK